MQSLQHLSRIELCEFKSQMVKKLGPERTRQYFHYLDRLLTLKIRKTDFSKICLRIMGRENIQLHNQLIGAILKNAFQVKVPPKNCREEDPELVVAAGSDSVGTSDGHQQIGQCGNLTQTLNSAVLSNGDAFPPSPRKARSAMRERKSGAYNADRLNGMIDHFSHLSKDAGDKRSHFTKENGNAKLPDVEKLLQHHRVPIGQEGNEEGMHHPNKIPEINRSQDDRLDAHSRDSAKLVNAQVGEETPSRSLIHAPLGIQLCSVSAGSPQKISSLASRSGYANSYDYGALFDTETLRGRIEQIATVHGLGAVSMDCANLLNNGLNSYLKRLISSSIELVRSRSGNDLTHNLNQKRQAVGKLANGLRPIHQSQVQSSNWPLEGLHQRESFCSVSLLDFKVAMELNPLQLGEHWPLLLEKISSHLYED